MVLTKTSQFISGAQKKSTFWYKATKSLVKKYPKSSAAIGGAIGYDIFDDDIMAKKHNFLNKIEHESRSKFKKTSISSNKSRIKWSSMNKHKKRMHKK